MSTVHDHERMTVDDLTLVVSPATDRTTLEVIVDRDASLIVKAPRNTTVEDVAAFVRRKRPWIYRRLAEKDVLGGPPVLKTFVDGEGFAYLGRSYRLLIAPDADGVRLDRGRFRMSPALTATGPAEMINWYRSAGARWLPQRLRPWAARMGESDVAVDVRDLGYRWGSCSTLGGPRTINIHWASLQLPPSLVDYVLVHELAHLTDPNHTAVFWERVGRVLPHHAELKSAVAKAGTSLWLGAVDTS